MRATFNLGFTLLELLVVIAMVAILTAIAYPSMSDAMARRHLDAGFRDVVSSLKTAKSSAIDDKRFDYVVVCASGSGSACDSNDWGQGWIAFGDANANGDLDADETTFFQQDELGGGSRLSVLNFNSGDELNRVIINRDGFTADNLYSCGNAGPPAYVFRLCPRQTSGNASLSGRAVIYTPSGAVRLSRDTDNDGIQNVGVDNINCS